MGDYTEYYKTTQTKKATGRDEQLLQLLRITFDGDLISKAHRDELVKNGLAFKVEGYNLITEKGIIYLNQLGFIHP